MIKHETILLVCVFNLILQFIGATGLRALISYLWQSSALLFPGMSSMLFLSFLSSFLSSMSKTFCKDQDKLYTTTCDLIVRNVLLFFFREYQFLAQNMAKKLKKKKRQEQSYCTSSLWWIRHWNDQIVIIQWTETNSVMYIFFKNCRELLEKGPSPPTSNMRHDVTTFCDFVGTFVRQVWLYLYATGHHMSLVCLTGWGSMLWDPKYPMTLHDNTDDTSVWTVWFSSQSYVFCVEKPINQQKPINWWNSIKILYDEIQTDAE